jgi:uncharacterized SAM-binding protein YcdF (DUF218 family)
LLLVILAWVAGLVYFAALIPVDVGTADTPADAIVVLTGGSDRLEEGLRLLAAGKAQLLLISGVNRDVTPSELLGRAAAAAGLSPQAVDCCVTIGYEAGNTVGNARETAAWSAAKGIRSLHLVTADYHMPRSLLEFARAMPEVRILAHPVFPERVKRDEWWLWPGSASLIVNEYHKYLAAVARGWFDDVAGLVGLGSRP